MRRRFSHVVVLTAAAIVLSAGTASGSPNRGGSGAAIASLSQLDVSTVGSIKAYVRTLGFDPKQFVIQRGNRNYAGPACPGAGWNCTTSGRVVQVASGPHHAFGRAGRNDDDDDDENRAVCETGDGDDDDDASDVRTARTGIGQEDPPPPPPPLEPPPLIECQIVQLAPPGRGKNVATCVQVTSDPAIRGLCEITQLNVGGRNVANVRQVFTPSTLAEEPAFALFTQFGEQRSAIVQASSTGDSRADIEQRISERIGFGLDPLPDLCCLQQAQQSSTLEQVNGSGDNKASVSQRYSLSIRTRSSIVFGFQGGAQEASNDQNAVSGRQRLTVQEVYSQEIEAPNAAAGGFMAQNAQCLFCFFGGTEGLAGEIDQSSGASSVADVEQRGLQRISSGPGVLQAQFDPFRCCMTQTGNPRNRAKIDQRLSQFANAPDGFLERGAELEGNCTTSGNCTAYELLNQDGVKTERSGSGSDVHISIIDKTCPPFCVGPPGPPATAAPSGGSPIRAVSRPRRAG